MLEPATLQKLFFANDEDQSLSFMFPGHGDYFSCHCPAVAAVAQTLTQTDDSVVLSRVTGCYRVLLISEGFLTILLLFRVGSDFGVSSSQTNLSISIRPFTPHRRPIPPEDLSKTQKHFNFLSCSENLFGSNPLVLKYQCQNT